MAKKSTIRIHQFKSGAGCPKDQRATLKGLGFRKMNQTVELEDTPAVRGMVNKVCHLVRIVEA